MNPLVPADKPLNPFLNADLGLEPELLAGPPQVGVREPHVTRLVAAAPDPRLAPERVRGQRAQPVGPHAGPAPAVARLGRRAPGGGPPPPERRPKPAPPSPLSPPRRAPPPPPPPVRRPVGGGAREGAPDPGRRRGMPAPLSGAERRPGAHPPASRDAAAGRTPQRLQVPLL